MQRETMSWRDAMRTMRTLMAGAVALALVVGVSVSAMAQDYRSALAEGDYVFVTGVEESIACGGGACTGKYVVNDPRMSGDLDITLELGCSTDMTCWMGGGITVSNYDGAWDGRWVGFIDAGGVHDIMEWMEGSGEYEGWSYVAFFSGLDDSASGDVRGILYRGDLPPSVTEGRPAPAE
jgi:hypothetical protein